MTRLQPFFSTIELFTGNLHLTEIQLITKKELRNKSGIYGFICKTNNKLYIGSSINLSSRFNNHIKGVRSNILLQRAINKYNLQDFMFIIFEFCEPDELLSREQHYINTFKPELNVLKVAGSLKGYTHTSETITKISGERNHMYGKNHTSNSINKIKIALSGENHYNFGRSLSEDTKALLSLAHKQRSEETKMNMSIVRGTPIYVYSSDKSILLYTFSSAKKAGAFFKLNHSTILDHARKEKLLKEQWFITLSLISN